MDDGYLKDHHFSEIQIKELELAALLHDFGKVYIDLAVFKKAKKLYPKDFDNLCLRLNYLYRFLELQYSSREAESAEGDGQERKFDRGLRRADQGEELQARQDRGDKGQTVRNERARGDG